MLDPDWRAFLPDMDEETRAGRWGVAGVLIAVVLGAAVVVLLVT